MDNFLSYTNKCKELCEKKFNSSDLSYIKPDELNKATLDYFKRGGKRIRPAILMLSAGITGGEIAEQNSVDAALAVELFHTFTLIHDDIIDNDDIRRGKPSAHKLISDMFGSREYGIDTAILAGDSLHALSVSLMLDSVNSGAFKPETVIKVTKLFETECLANLICGEQIDTKLGLFSHKNGRMNIADFGTITDVYKNKTGVLLGFSAKAGAMLGASVKGENEEYIGILSEFAETCGIAFQIKDDILGLMSDETTLGKPILSDLREGKETVILSHAINNVSKADKEFLITHIGNKDSDESDLARAKDIIINAGSIDYANNLSEQYTRNAINMLRPLPKSEYLDCLVGFAHFMSQRDN